MDQSQQGWTLRRDKRTGIWCVRYAVAGRRYHRSTGTRDRGEAQKRAAQIYAAALTGIVGARVGHRPLEGVDIDVLFGRWLAAMEKEKPNTARTFHDYVRAHWVPFFGRASDLCDETTLARYVEHRLDHVTASTVKKECSALQNLLTWCARKTVGYLIEAPTVPRPARDAQGTRAKEHMLVELAPWDAAALIAKLPEYVRAREAGEPPRPCRALFETMWETGLRRGTLFGIEAPRDYQRGDSELRVRVEIDKGKWARSLPLTAAAREALDSVCPKSGFIFPRIDLRAQLEKAALAIGLHPDIAKHLGHHDLRHGRATELVDAGAPLTGVAYLLGHRRISTTDGYAHSRRRAADAAIAVVDGHRDGHRPLKTATPAGEGGRAIALDPQGIAEERTRTSTGVTHQILSLVARLKTSRFQGDIGSAEASEGPGRAPDGHGVRLRAAAIALCEAVVARDPHLAARALDVADLVAEHLEAIAPRIHESAVSVGER
jgi:site-specific recombinase XerD